jgi:hypothetical protein
MKEGNRPKNQFQFSRMKKLKVKIGSCGKWLVFDNTKRQVISVVLK